MKKLFEDKRKIYLLTLLVGIIVVIIWAIFSSPERKRQEIVEYQRPDWAQDLPQDPEKIVDVKQAFPYSGKYFTISQTNEVDVYNVEYAPYLTRDEAKPLIEDFMRTYGIDKLTVIWDDDGQFPRQTYDLSNTHE